MDFQQTKTYQNLLQAYQEELMAGTRYSIFSDIARNEGCIEISNIYNTAVRNEKEHARVWLRRLNQGMLPNTVETLQEASLYEADNVNNMYQEFARVAREEGYNEIAALFSGIANIDLYHGENFKILTDNIIRGQEFCKPISSLWICTQCGNILYGDCAPVICPVCGFPQGYYKLLDDKSIIT